MNKNIFVIFGVSGLIGTELAKTLHKNNEYTIGITRNINKTKKKLPFLNELLDTAYIKSNTFNTNTNNFIFINLSAEPLIGLWTKTKSRRVLESRLDGINKSISLIKKYNLNNSTILCASGIGIYGNNFTESQSEDSKTSDDTFVSQMSKKIEQKLNSSEISKNINMRFGIVLSKNGGSLKYLNLIYNMGIGGPIGKGNQWWSWIHIDDVINSILHIVQNNLEGPINITSPNPEKQKDFSKILAKNLQRPSLMYTPAFVLKIILGNFATELLDSKKIVPKKLIDSNFKFKFDYLKDALNNIYNEK